MKRHVSPHALVRYQNVVNLVTARNQVTAVTTKTEYSTRYSGIVHQLKWHVNAKSAIAPTIWRNKTTTK